jgi:hypothetical protein
MLIVDKNKEKRMKKITWGVLRHLAPGAAIVVEIQSNIYVSTNEK